MADRELLAKLIRAKVIELSNRAGTPHLGSALSCSDILVSLYRGILKLDPKDPHSPHRDRFILSKGHAATALYSILAFSGFFPLSVLDTYAQPGSTLAEQPSPNCQPGVEAATGSLGHGLPIGLGMALASRINKRPYDVYVLMSDGECNEGSVWEAALMAPAQKLSNLTVIVDFNRWQATGRSDEVMALAPLRAKWEAFGWNAHDVDGHDIEAIQDLLNSRLAGDTRPTAIVAHTVKGKGVSFMEDDNNWHYRIPTDEEVVRAKKELGVE